jgi:hypothetical protein
VATKSVSSASAGRVRPVDPAELVVLAVGVVVALLGVAELVAGEQQRDAFGEQQRGQQVAALAGAYGQSAREVLAEADAVDAEEATRMTIARPRSRSSDTSR